MANLPADRTKLALAQGNQVPSVVIASAKNINSITEAYDTIDMLYNYINGFVTSGTLSPMPPGDYNKLINGNFDVWEQGTAFTLGSTAGYTADMWKFVRSGAGTTTITQDTSVPSNGKSKYALKCGGSYQNGEFEDKKYYIESIDAAKLSGQEVTISVQHKDAVSAGSNSMQILVYYASAVDNYAVIEAVGFSSQLALTADYSLAELTLTLPATSASGYSIGNGVLLVFRHIQVGTTGSLITYLSQVQMCASSVSLPFQPRIYADELQACRRYLYVLDSKDNTNSTFCPSYHYNATLSLGTVVFPVKMRVTPTLIASAASTFVVVNTAASIALTGPVTINQGSKNTAALNLITSGLTQGQGSSLNAAGTVDAYLMFDARI